ncbi:MAG: hypothetical protein HRU37_07705 [Roseibacillus sp.]|nr:hypothetical protein [Roseibacillus sp.]
MHIAQRAFHTLISMLLGLATGIADPVRQQDIGASSPWAAHVDLAKVNDSPLSSLLFEIAGFDRIMQLQKVLKEKLAIDVKTAEGVTLFGSGENSQETAVIVRGKFESLDLSGLSSAPGGTYRGVQLHEGPQWQTDALFLASPSASELVAGTSLPAVREALDVLAGRQKSWQGVSLTEHAKKELNSATALLALDMKRIGGKLQFESDFTRSIRRAWFLIGSRDDQVEAAVLIDSTDAAGLAYLQTQLQFLTVMLKSQEGVPPAWLELMSALKVEAKDHWMTAKVGVPREKAAGLLRSLGPLFQTEAKQPTPAE